MNPVGQCIGIECGVVFSKKTHNIDNIVALIFFFEGKNQSKHAKGILPTM